MNALSSGTLTVMLATTVASLLILFSGSSVADSAEKTKEITSSDGVKKEVSALANSTGIKGNIDKSKEQSAHEKVNLTTTSPPPPGPFIFSNSDDKMDVRIKKQQTPQALNKKTKDIHGVTINLPPESIDAKKQLVKAKKPKAQETPQGNAANTKSVEPEFRRMQPSLPSAPVNSLKAPLSIAKKIAKSAKPEFKRLQPSFPPAPVSSFTVPIMKHVTGNQPKKIVELPPARVKRPAPAQPKQKYKVMPRAKPIWMQQPSFSGFTQPGKPIRQHQSRQAPVQNWHNYNGGGQVNQQYIYIPMPLNKPNFSYPQMPMYGGYNLAPTFGKIGKQQASPNAQKPNKVEIK